MKTILAVLGGFFLFMVVLIAAAIFFLFRKLKTIRNQLEESLTAGPPLKIHLNEDLNQDWIGAPVPSRFLRDLEEIGFQRGKAYTVAETPELSLISLFNTDPSVCAVVYAHQNAGYWVDLIVQYEDDTLLSVSNLQKGGTFDHPPNHERVLKKDARPAELCRLALEHLKPKPIVDITDNNFREIYEQNFQRDMAWRAKRKGFPVEGMNGIAQESAININETQFREAMMGIKLNEIRRWHNEAISIFLNETDSKEYDDANEYGNLFIVSDFMQREAMIDYLDGFLDFSEEQANAFKDLCPKYDLPSELFDWINNSLPEESRAEWIGSVAAPAPADIYRIPSPYPFDEDDIDDMD